MTVVPVIVVKKESSTPPTSQMSFSSCVGPLPSSIAISPVEGFGSDVRVTARSLTSSPSCALPLAEHDVPMAPVVVTSGVSVWPVESRVSTPPPAVWRRLSSVWEERGSKRRWSARNLAKRREVLAFSVLEKCLPSRLVTFVLKHGRS